MPMTLINGNQLYWELSGGTGEPVVLVHGSWGDHHSWSPVLPALSGSSRVLTYDRRGHSKSERPSGQGSVHEDVADLAALLEHLDHHPAHIIGISSGASIVLRLAGERPELFRSMIVHEPALFDILDDEPKAQDTLTEFRQRVGAVVKLLMAGDHAGGARLFAETIASGPGAWGELPANLQETSIFNAPTWLDETQDPDFTTVDLERLRRFTAPSLLTVGGQSPPFFTMVVDRIARALESPERQTFADAGHVPHRTHPDEYARVVTSFIQGTD